MNIFLKIFTLLLFTQASFLRSMSDDDKKFCQRIVHESRQAHARTHSTINNIENSIQDLKSSVKTKFVIVNSAQEKQATALDDMIAECAQIRTAIQHNHKIFALIFGTVGIITLAYYIYYQQADSM